MSQGVGKIAQSVTATFGLESRNAQSQVKSYGERISILGVWQPERSFDYALVQGNFSKKRYVRVMNKIAQTAEQMLQQTGRIMVVVQDTGSSYTSHLAREH